MPINYPFGIIGNTSPYFIWLDNYLERDDNSVRYRISVKTEKADDITPLLIKPEIYGKYYFFKLPFALEPDNYTYKIERVSEGHLTDSKYFHSLKYPISGSFELDPSQKTPVEDLSPLRLIEYLKLEKENKLQNGYNFLFYSTASAGSFGIGLLFYRVLQFGIISKIIYTVAFISSGAGICAAGYYGYNYLAERSEMKKIADIGSNVSVNYNVRYANAAIDFRLLY